MTTVLGRIYLLAAGAWFGGIVAIATALPILFGTDVVTRTQGARLAGEILARFDGISLVLLPVLWIGAIAVLRITTGRCRIATVVFLLILTGSQLGGTFAIRPPMAELADEIRTFERSDPMTPARERFNRLHRTAEGLMTVNLAALGALLVLYPGMHAVRPRRDGCEDGT